jgi:butyryl-CoA dehydrogenase
MEAARADDIAYALRWKSFQRSALPPRNRIRAQFSVLLAHNQIRHRAAETKIPAHAGRRAIGAFGLTEADAGTDASAQRTTAVLEGDHYVLNGAKIFITNGGVSDINVVFAMTDRSKGKQGKFPHLLSKAALKVFSKGKKEEKMGIRASSTTELIMEDCIVPRENLLGEEGKGFAIAMSTLDGGRIGNCRAGRRHCRRALQEAVKYTKTEGTVLENP